MDLNDFLHVACNYQYLWSFLTWKYWKQGFWGCGGYITHLCARRFFNLFSWNIFPFIIKKIRNLSIVYIYDNLNSWKQHIASQCISLFQNSLLFLTFIIRDCDKSFQLYYKISMFIFIAIIYISYIYTLIFKFYVSLQTGIANKNPKSGLTYICLPSTSQQSLSTTESQMCAQLQKEFNFQVTQNKNRYN